MCFADAVCACGNDSFKVFIDENEGCAVRVCSRCELDAFIGDSEDYIDDARLWEAECSCGGSSFRVAVGVALYRDSEDVRWLYLGLGCSRCELAGVYADWKNEFRGVDRLLSRV